MTAIQLKSDRQDEWEQMYRHVLFEDNSYALCYKDMAEYEFTPEYSELKIYCRNQHDMNKTGNRDDAQNKNHITVYGGDSFRVPGTNRQ